MTDPSEKTVKKGRPVAVNLELFFHLELKRVDTREAKLANEHSLV